MREGECLLSSTPPPDRLITPLAARTRPALSRVQMYDERQAYRQDRLDADNGVVVTKIGRHIPPTDAVGAAAVLVREKRKEEEEREREGGRERERETQRRLEQPYTMLWWFVLSLRKAFVSFPWRTNCFLKGFVRVRAVRKHLAFLPP